MSSYFNVYKAARPLVKIAGQKSVKTIKSAAKQAKEKTKQFFEKVDVDKKFKKAKEKLDKTLDNTDTILKKFGKTVDKQKKILGGK
tara:strand:+ start:315 stop:572 length:258 start_codon:yes stop_codon:yes gene_type:complete